MKCLNITVSRSISLLLQGATVVDESIDGEKRKQREQEKVDSIGLTARE